MGSSQMNGLTNLWRKFEWIERKRSPLKQWWNEIDVILRMREMIYVKNKEAYMDAEKARMFCKDRKIWRTIWMVLVISNFNYFVLFFSVFLYSFHAHSITLHILKGNNMINMYVCIHIPFAFWNLLTIFVYSPQKIHQKSESIQKSE